MPHEVEHDDVGGGVAGGKTMRLVSKTYYESFPNIFDFIASLGLHSSSPWDGA